MDRPAIVRPGLPTDAELIDLAGTAAFARGRAYREAQRVRLTRVDDERIEGQARGSTTYRLRLARSGKRWHGHCECPAADGGAFCKHLVAAVLVARDGPLGDEIAERGSEAATSAATVDADAQTADHSASSPSAGRGRRPAAAADDLMPFLRAQPSERLAGWLQQFAAADRDIDRRLRLYRAADDPAQLKAALSKLLTPGGFLDWRASNRYALRLDAGIEQLRALRARDPASCRSLFEYALARLLRIYERSDDSSGAIGERVRALANLHAEACALEPPGKPLAKVLYKLQRDDHWDFLPLADYWHALGSEGQRAYGTLIVDEFARLPAKPDASDRYGEALEALHRCEAYARCAGDFDLLQRVLRRDLSHPYDHQRVVDSLREFGREREALAFAEAAVRRFPRDARLRAALAGCLDRAGLADEALEQLWNAFSLEPGDATWDALKQASATHWPRWRERALAQVAADERGAATTRMRLLLHDGDARAALALARSAAVAADVLEQLADHVAASHPDAAGEIYLALVRNETPGANTLTYARLVAHLQRAARLAPERTRPVVAGLRRDHARKTRLMALLDQAHL